MDVRYGPLIWALTCLFLVWVALLLRWHIMVRYKDSRLGAHAKGQWFGLYTVGQFIRGVKGLGKS